MEKSFPFACAEAVRFVLKDELSRLVVTVFLHLNLVGQKMDTDLIHEAIVNRIPLPISDLQVAAAVAAYQASLPAKVPA